MAYCELIKNFEAIREYMREFYVYGFRSREEIGSKSTRSYDNERRRIESWLGDYMSFHQDASGKAQFLSVDTRSIHQNPLYNAFKAKSFTDKDVILHFYLLDLLEEDEWLSFRDVVDGLYSKYFDRFKAGVDMDETTIRNKLKEYVKIGLLEQQKNGKAYEYRRAAQKVNIESWKEAVAFYTEADPLGIVGSFIADREGMRSDTFLFKHKYILYALDSEILYGLLDIISQRCKADITVKSRISQKGNIFTVLPMHIYVSTQNGREYLLAHDYYKREFSFLGWIILQK